MRIVFPAFLAAVLLGISPLPARAQRCGDETTQAATNSCFERQYRQSDAALNDAYRQVMTRLRNEAAATRSLVAAQRAWIGFRDAECAFAAGPAEGGGSARPMVVSQCLEEQTRTRTRALEGYLNCPEGDLSCPLPPK